MATHDPPCTATGRREQIIPFALLYFRCGPADSTVDPRCCTLSLVFFRLIDMNGKQRVRALRAISDGGRLVARTTGRLSSEGWAFYESSSGTKWER